MYRDVRQFADFERPFFALFKRRVSRIVGIVPDRLGHCELLFRYPSRTGYFVLTESGYRRIKIPVCIHGLDGIISPKWNRDTIRPERVPGISAKASIWTQPLPGPSF